MRSGTGGAAAAAAAPAAAPGAVAVAAGAELKARRMLQGRSRWRASLLDCLGRAAGFVFHCCAHAGVAWLVCGHAHAVMQAEKGTPKSWLLLQQVLLIAWPKRERPVSRNTNGAPCTSMLLSD